MPRATCRCGQRLSFPAEGADRVICPKCSARIRVRRRDLADGGAVPEEGDGFIRFACPCGRRLKVRDTEPRPESGRCPECGRVVPVPVRSSVPPSPAAARRGGVGDPEASTIDMDAADIAELVRWAESYTKKVRPQPAAPNVKVATASADSPGAAVTEAFPPNGGGLLEEFATPEAPAQAAPVKTEAGLRVCPRCGRPVHLGAETCRQCGAHVPRR